MIEKTKLVMRADGGPGIGMGHIVRLISLANLLGKEFQICFALTSYSDVVLNLLHENRYIFSTFHNEPSFINSLKGNEIVFIDSYKSQPNELAIIKAKGCKLVFINDLVRQDLRSCDLVINHTPGYERSDFNVSPNAILLLGHEYCLIRDEFYLESPRRVISEIKTITISLGQSDSGLLLNKVVDICYNFWQSSRINVLNGPNIIGEDLRSSERVTLLNNLNVQDMVALFDNTDLAIVPVSGLYMEALSRGSIVLGGYFAENHMFVYNQLAGKEIVVELGDFRQLDMKNLFEIKATIERQLPKVNSPNLGSKKNEIFEIVKNWR